MTVENIYDKRFTNTVCKVVGYYNGADYGFLHGNKEYCDVDLLQQKVKAISVDKFNGDDICICIMID